MARAIWKGTLTFGLVEIPVALHAAESADELHFSFLDQRNFAPIQYRKVNAKTAKEVPWESVVRGYEIEKGHYVVLSDEDFKRANSEATQTVRIQQFVDAGEIPPIFFERPYYLAPTSKSGRSYALLRETMKRTQKVGIGTVVIRTRQQLAAVLVHGPALVLDILRFAHEIRGVDQLDLPGEKLHAVKGELDMAERLVAAMSGHFRPEDYQDTYRDDLLRMIEKKSADGKAHVLDESKVEAPPSRPAVIDLMPLLKESIERTHGAKRGEKSGKGRRTGARRAPARPRKRSIHKRKTA